MLLPQSPSVPVEHLIEQCFGLVGSEGGGIREVCVLLDRTMAGTEDTCVESDGLSGPGV